jgi:Ca2+-binding RTX toxin-like protein
VSFEEPIIVGMAAGNDSLSAAGVTATGGMPFTQSPTVYSDSGNDYGSGGPATGTGTFYGDDGDDVFGCKSSLTTSCAITDDGAWTVWGGNGNDEVSYANRSGAIAATMDGAAANDGETGEADDLKSDVEIIRGGSAGDVLQGNGNANILYGNGGPDSLWGGAGPDTAYGGDGDDTWVGQDGDGATSSQAREEQT